MKLLTLGFILAAIAFWGLWGFLVKLAVQKIGLQALFWNSLFLTLTVIIFLLLTNQVFPFKTNLSGISLAILSGVASGLASVFFYLLLEKNPVGFLVATTALYPLITIVLSVIFLRESLTIAKIAGFILALGALFLLNL